MKRLPAIRYIVTLVALTLVYFIAGKLGLALAYVHPSASSVWAPTGIALAAFLCLGYRVWPAIALAAFFVNVTTAGSVVSAIGITAGNTLEGLAGAWLVTYFSNGRKALEQPQDVVRFMILGGFVSTLISPTLGVTSLVLTGFAPWAAFGRIWLTWWLGDAAGALLVAPLLILWGRKGTVRWSRLKLLEVAFLALSLVYLGLLVFGGLVFSRAQPFPLEFLCIPPLIWTAYRFGERETATATILLSAIALWGTLHGYGPFARTSPGNSLLLLQTFMGVIAAMGLILSALVTERDQSETVLQNTNKALEQRVEERTISLSNTVVDLRAEVQQRKAIEKNLRDSEERFRLLVETIKDYALFMLDPEGKVISWNAGAERVKGYTTEEILGRHFSVFYTQKDIDQGKPEQTLKQAISEGHAQDVGIRLRKDGTSYWVDTVLTALYGKKGELRGFAKVTRDITERRQTEQALHESEARFRQLVDSNIIGFMQLDGEGRAVDANDTLLKMLGYTREDLKNPGLPEEALTPVQFHPLDQWMRDRVATNGTCPPMEKEFVRKDGCRVPVLVGMVQMSGTDRHRLCFVIDVTERRSAQDALRKAYDEMELRVQQRTSELQDEIKRRERAEEELRNQAIRDSLTGLYNRRGFMTLAEKHLQLARRQQKPLLLFMADLDDLKKINDSLGHAEGDYALVKAGEIIRKTFRESDILARIGGDEYAVAGVEEEGNTEGDLVGRLDKNLDDYNRYSGRPYQIRLSIGTARINPDSTVPLEQLIQQADTMMYEQKKHKASDVFKQPSA